MRSGSRLRALATAISSVPDDRSVRRCAGSGLLLCSVLGRHAFLLRARNSHLQSHSWKSVTARADCLRFAERRLRDAELFVDPRVLQAGQSIILLIPVARR